MLRRLAVSLGLLCSLLSTMPAAADIPKDPVLRIETGGHTATITRISSDSAGNWAVTSSEDKTARLWDLRTFKPVAVLRPPLGSESVGALYAAAMSPDGKTVALGGNAAFDAKTHALYLFDRANGNLPPKSTLSGIEAPITQLAWSADNQFIAVGLRQEGLRVFKRNLGFVGSDPQYNDAIYGAAFAPDGRLAVVSLDGYLRVYKLQRGNLERVARKQLTGVPYTLAWSPDGSSLAIGLQDSAKVLVLDGASLQTTQIAEVAGSGNLGRVAWAMDGRTLYATGNVSRNARFPIFAFPDMGKGAARELDGFSNIATSLLMTAKGLLASSAEPAWALFEPNTGDYLGGNKIARADFRDAGDTFRVSADGQAVVFPVTVQGKDLMSFDLSKGELRPINGKETVQAPRIPTFVSNWKNKNNPQASGQALNLSPNEIARSVAATADQGRFALGSDWNLRLYTAKGELLWTQRTPAAVWAVNINSDTKNGEWIVAALADGSVRWYRSRDGVEQLALFVHGDKERWIIWSPNGYYDTSIGGESLIGWHVNRAFNQSADFFSVGRFRERFYQPNIIQKIAQMQDETAAVSAFQAELALLQEMNKEAEAATGKPSQKMASSSNSNTDKGSKAFSLLDALPPVIEVQSERQIEAADAQIKLRYALRTASNAPVKNVKIRVNGKLERGVKLRSLGQGDEPDKQAYEAVVNLPPKDSEVLLIAENKYGKSEPVSIQVRRPSKLAATSSSSAAPYYEKYDTLYMLVIAVNKYPGDWALQQPVKDASDFSSQMARVVAAGKSKLPIYDKLVVHKIVDEKASQDGVREELKWLSQNVKANDAVVLFLAGHGTTENQSYYFIPHVEKLAKTPEKWVSGKDIISMLEEIPGRAMFFLDTCHSGALANQAKLAGTINQVEEERGVIVFASATAKEKAQESDEWGNGAFTKALIEGLQGQAENPKDKLIYATDLRRYVTKRVRELTNNQQRPYISDHGIDDPIAVPAK